MGLLKLIQDLSLRRGSVEEGAIGTDDIYYTSMSNEDSSNDIYVWGLSGLHIGEVGYSIESTHG